MPQAKHWVFVRAASDDVLHGLQQFDGNQSIEQVLKGDAFVDKTARRVVLYQAIRACAADSSYSTQEQSMVRRMARALGIPDHVVAAMTASGRAASVYVLCTSVSTPRRRAIAVLTHDPSV